MRAQKEAGGPRQAWQGPVGDQPDGQDREGHQPDRQLQDRPQPAPEIDPGRLPGVGVEQRRQEDREDHPRRDLERGEGRDQRPDYAGDREKNRRRDRDLRRQEGDHPDDTEHQDEDRQDAHSWSIAWAPAIEGLEVGQSTSLIVRISRRSPVGGPAPDRGLREIPGAPGADAADPSTDRARSESSSAAAGRRRRDSCCRRADAPPSPVARCARARVDRHPDRSWLSLLIRSLAVEYRRVRADPANVSSGRRTLAPQRASRVCSRSAHETRALHVGGGRLTERRMAQMTPAEQEAFPSLTAGQIARIAPFARERDLADGESLWEAGDRNRPMFVVVRGEIEILSGADHVVTVHNAGAFTGDVDLLSGRPVVVRARARGAASVLELPPARLRSMIQTDAELSEIFLRAFMLRRLALMAQGGGNIVLIGSRHCAGTLALQEFLTRNSQPHGYIDLEGDPAVQETLGKFRVRVEDVPVLLCRGTRVLRRPTIEDVADCLGLSDLNETVARDLAVIRAGPAGLSTAVYAASEGLDVLVIEARSPGGPAGSRSRVWDYPGF